MPITETQAPTKLDLTWVRAQFPALAQTVNGHPAVFLDGPGRTQVPQREIDGISGYLHRNTANTAGAYATSRDPTANIAPAGRPQPRVLHYHRHDDLLGPHLPTP